MCDTPQTDKNTTTPTSAAADPLALPAPEVLAEIARKQNARAAERLAARAERRRSKEAGSEDQSRNKAAVVIQRNYRGHRTRRAMRGFSTDPSTRWIEVR